MLRMMTGIYRDDFSFCYNSRSKYAVMRIKVLIEQKKIQKIHFMQRFDVFLHLYNSCYLQAAGAWQTTT